MLKQRIPTILGIILLLGGAVAGVIFVSQQTSFLPRAAPEHVPSLPKTTNITENSFIVSWTTKEPINGYIKMGRSQSKLDTTIKDQRDQLSGTTGDYRTHYITVSGLEPQTTYYFKIYSDKQAYDNNGRPYQVTTAPVLSTPPASDTAYGSVVTPADTPADGAIVYFTMPDTTPLSALVKDGNYSVSLSTARSQSLREYAQYDPQKTRIDVRVETGKSEEVAKATTTTQLTQPIPTITLGETLDFTSQTQVTDPGSSQEDEVVNQARDKAQSSDTASTPASKFTFDDFSNVSESSDSGVVSITRIDQAVVGAQTQTVLNTKPKISGKAPANATIVIEVHSNQVFTDTVTASATGDWEWEPPDDLEPGEHSVTLTYLDEEGREHTVTKTFVVASDSAADPDYSASPSATTATPTPTPTPTSTLKPTPTATLSPRTSLPSTSSGVPVAGSTDQTLTFALLSSLLILGGGGLWWWQAKEA